MKKILFTIFCLIFTLNTTQAAIKISPSYVELNANKTKKDFITGSFSVSGGKDEVVRFKVYPKFFEHNTNGDFVELEDKGQKNSLMGKVKIYPTEFSCENGAEQKVRFTITDIKSLPNGESRLVLFLEDKKTKEVIINNLGHGASGKIIIKTRVGVPIYVDKGLYSKKATLDSVALNNQKEGYTCEYKVSSTGNSKIRYKSLVYISQKDNLIKKIDLSGSTIEGGNKLDKTVKLDLNKDELIPNEEYKIKFVLIYTDENNHEKILKKEFNYKPTQIEQII